MAQCIYSNWEGECSLFDPDFNMSGCDKDGNCICEDDPDPTYLCESFEDIEGDGGCN